MDFAENPGVPLSPESGLRHGAGLRVPAGPASGGAARHLCRRPVGAHLQQPLPASVYGAEHPNTTRSSTANAVPGRASQWCLTNDELFELAAAKVDSIFRANPGMNIISISQNDSNFTYCRCEECEKVNQYEGAPSGNYIRFLNKLAERSPTRSFRRWPTSLRCSPRST